MLICCQWNAFAISREEQCTADVFVAGIGSGIDFCK
jgi:hypothetical protein